MAFANMVLTTDGMMLYAKAQQGKRLHITRVVVGDGVLAPGESMVNRSGLKSQWASFLIDHVHIDSASAAAEIVFTMSNDSLEEERYFRELGVLAEDPDTKEDKLYLYDYDGVDAERIPSSHESTKVFERIKLILRLENTPNVTFALSGNPLYLTSDDIDDEAKGPGVLWSSLKVAEVVRNKQEKITGTMGQVVGFNKNGEPVSMDAPQSLPVGGTVGQVLGKTGEEDGQAGWVNPPVIVKILETICENVTVNNDNPSVTFASPITLDGTATYYLSYKYYLADGSSDPSNSGYIFSKVEGEGDASFVRWLTADENNSVTLTNAGVADSWRGAGKSAIVSVYRVEIVQSNELEFSAIQKEGYNTYPSGEFSHVEGKNSIASGLASHAEGSSTTASGSNSHAEGGDTTASGYCSHSEGCYTQATDQGAHAEGLSTVASGIGSHAGGQWTIAKANYQTVIGIYNIESSNTFDKFIVGNGSPDSRSNCFRVTYGGVYAKGNYNTSGADYAELFEWADGNPDHQDRCGLFVTLQGDRIRIASPDDDCLLGIVSGSPSVVGDVYDDQWAGMFLTDIFGRPVYEDVELPAELGPDGEVILPARTERRQKLNPAYDNAEKYVPRTQRPEWDAVGLVGKLVAVDDGTCVPDGWCTVGEGGVATASPERTKYRVMARLDERHVRVMIL